MKNIMLSAIAVMLLFLSGCYVYQPPTTVVASQPPPVQPPPPQPPASYQTFYDDLAPYGTWVSDPRYGYVWLPNVAPGFRPYVTDGYWAYSDAGWTWVSYYNWGWAPFHYGRWFDDSAYGWMWVPGNEWAPAWVTWGNYNGYYGWAPLPPGYQAGTAYYAPINYWCFTEPRYMGDRNWDNHYYEARDQRIYMGGNTYIEDVHRISYINNTNNYNSRIYNAGPRRDEIENITRTPIQTLRINEYNKPEKSEISNGSLKIYRPRLSNESRSGETAKPNTIAPIENMKQGQRTPVKQEERTPEINNERNPAGRPAIRQEPSQQPGERTPNRPSEMREPVITPQQQTPRQDNNTAPQRTRENQQPIMPQQQQQTPRQGNIQTPQGTRTNQPITPAKQRQQKGKNTTKQSNKQVKSPARTKPIENATPAEQTSPGKKQ